VAGFFVVWLAAPAVRDRTDAQVLQRIACLQARTFNRATFAPTKQRVA